MQAAPARQHFQAHLLPQHHPISFYSIPRPPSLTVLGPLCPVARVIHLSARAPAQPSPALSGRSHAAPNTAPHTPSVLSCHAMPHGSMHPPKPPAPPNPRALKRKKRKKTPGCHTYPIARPRARKRQRHGAKRSCATPSLPRKHRPPPQRAVNERAMDGEKPPATRDVRNTSADR